MSYLYVTDREEWRSWLEKNHSTEKEIWLIYYKKHTGRPRIPYDDAVEEALCFGWIDSTVKRIDGEKYCQRFTPRRKKSGWSKLNKARVKELIKNGKMDDAGFVKIEAAKRNGMWDRVTEPVIVDAIPASLERALSDNKKAKEFFCGLSPSCQKQYAGWIASAKREETREKRIAEAVRLLNNSQKLGMK